MTTALVYDPHMGDYRFGPGHPMLPERFTLAIDLMRAWGLLGESESQARIVVPQPATHADLLRVHAEQYVAVVEDQSAAAGIDERFGLGPGDTPRFPHAHEVASLIAGGTSRALDGVLAQEWVRAFAPAGGLHHAHRDRAAGFCIYNDPAVAIARATVGHPGLRVAYVDIDAHHGDGVQEAFARRADVLTVSVHESGQYLYPGTGASRDIGDGAGTGYSVNLPMPPHAGDAEYALALQQVIEPAVRAFGPDLIVAQLGADGLASDPLAHLRLSVAGHVALARGIAQLADELCGGRLVATGGGGYDAYSGTPRAWACALAVLLSQEPPAELPAGWRKIADAGAAVHGLPSTPGPGTFDAAALLDPAVSAEETRRLAERAISQTRAASPLLAQD